ncbi:4-hydroxythreonine-4-phosphate dehydrogenase PdxA [Gluconobacter cerevisiae]|uniref:4-hydroxythreonine-4-phosphate dehydrogenase n=1 Tax=Gluconobacter cerevisiae TaxID=1379734 RepID=A0ABR9YG15_9PROT|nr:4-hydroxythreonine-4-phosphate dehydrogenase PdxA [Gluconobacter cerevisiae]MBF0877611.1 4-hydroxythreonine-4-phosphate dehydrogenase PdxA [Gluconobacter cerevisiae]
MMPLSRPLALTLGDPAGIGPQLAAEAWRRLRHSEEGAFFWLGDPRLVEAAVPLTLIETPEEAGAVFADSLPILPVLCEADVIPGQPDPRNAAATISSIRLAVEYALAGRAGGVVTNPIAKHVLAATGFPYPGHTEFLAALCGMAGEEIMMLVSPQLRVVPVTVHVSLRKALETLTTDRIVSVAQTANAALKRDFGIETPRLAIAGLNPHAGEQGLMGEEEITIIRPAIERLRAQGIDCQGPFPPDTMFSATARPNYDVAICMYHDQALIPLKTLDMAEGVNVTLGLPIIRTSPDHGTAFDIAGPVTETCRADVSSLLAAIRLADGMSAYREGKRS